VKVASDSQKAGVIGASPKMIWTLPTQSRGVMSKGDAPEPDRQKQRRSDARSTTQIESPDAYPSQIGVPLHDGAGDDETGDREEQDDAIGQAPRQCIKTGLRRSHELRNADVGGEHGDDGEPRAGRRYRLGGTNRWPY
jgi:hypothetical protein